MLARTLTFERLEDRRVLAITVNTSVDEADGSIFDGDISLRDAIANAPTGETINFSVTGTINLVFGQISIYNSVTINGPGANLLIVDARGSDPTPELQDGVGSRIFYVDDGDELFASDVKISGLSIVNGDVGNNGGGIFNDENLRLSEVNIEHNHAGAGGGVFSNGNRLLSINLSRFVQNSAIAGGGVYAGGADVSVRNSFFAENTARDLGGAMVLSPSRTTPIEIIGTEIVRNTAGSSGGGIYHIGSGAVLIASSEVAENSARNGGGVYVYHGGDVLVESSSFRANKAIGPFGAGGGIWINTGDLFLTNSLFTANESMGKGGGVFAAVDSFGGRSDVQVVNCTFSENTAGETGGGLHTNMVDVPVISSSTFYANSSGFGGAGVHASDVVFQSPAVKVKNSIFAANTANGLTPADISGRASASYCLVTSANGTLIVGPGNILGVNPLLGALADNGGPTFSHRPLLGSPVVNAGDPLAAEGESGIPKYDQRGFDYSRVVGGRLDMGAIERDAASADFNDDDTVDGADFLLWQRGLGIPSGATKAQGDADNDQDVDGQDLAAWKAAFGSTAALTQAETIAATLTTPVAASENRISAAQLADIAMAWTMLNEQATSSAGSIMGRGARRISISMSRFT